MRWLPRVLQLCAIIALDVVMAGAALAQCSDPPRSPRGRCIKAHGGTCDGERRIWVAPNERIRQLCASQSGVSDQMVVAAAGALPLILTAPHGGTLSIPGVPV